jgi:hypothetical protein
MIEHSKLESYVCILEAIRDNTKFPDWLSGKEVNHILFSFEEQGSIQRRPLILTEKGMQVINFFHKAQELEFVG